MRLLLNIFLIGFLIDSGLSVASTALGVLFDFGGLSGLQNLVGFIIMMLGFICYLLSGINASIPKKLLFPPVIFLAWAFVTAPPLPLFLDDTERFLVLSFIQLFFALGMMMAVKKKTGAWLLPEKMVPAFSFSLKKSFIFFSANIVILPVILLLVVFSSLQTLMNNQTAGFLKLTADGIYMREKIYQKDNKTIKLIGMIHIGEDAYYQNMVATIQQQNSVLMAEGVSDHQKMIKSGFSTKGFAEAYGLQSQEDLQIEGEYINEADLLSEDYVPTGNLLKIIRADVDISTFSKETIEFLNIAGQHVFREDSFAEGLEEYNQWVNEKGTPELIEKIKYDIIDRRNEKVISLIDDAVSKFSLVIIPWGAMHMPAIENSVLDMGFSNVKTLERKSMDFNPEKIKKLYDAFFLK